MCMVMNLFMESGHFLSGCMAVVFNGGFRVVGYVIKSDRQLWGTLLSQIDSCIVGYVIKSDRQLHCGVRY